MSRNRRAARPDLLADPFAERLPGLLRVRLPLLGAQFEFETNSEELLGLVKWAYADLPRQRLTHRGPRLKIRLLLAPAEAPRRGRSLEPAPLSLFAGAGAIGGAPPSSSFILASARAAAALIIVPRAMLRFPYHVRYEFLEFAAFTLAARCQNLVPLHAACVGQNGRGVLLLGASGAGKSTLTLCAALAGLDVLAEDSVFVMPRSLLATGVPNFLHVRAASLHWLKPSQRAAIRRAPTIRRRSGVTKHEVNLRQECFSPAPSALKLVAALFLSPQHARGRQLLAPLSKPHALRMLVGEQPFAAQQSGWAPFTRQWNKLPVHELRRGRHPQEGVDAVTRLLSDP